MTPELEDLVAQELMHVKPDELRIAIIGELVKIIPIGEFALVRAVIKPDDNIIKNHLKYCLDLKDYFNAGRLALLLGDASSAGNAFGRLAEIGGANSRQYKLLAENAKAVVEEFNAAVQKAYKKSKS